MIAQRQIILTPAGLKRIEDELELLRTVNRRRVAERMRDALDMGGEIEDNSELETAKNELAYVEGRIDELREILSVASVLEAEDVGTDSVGIGSIVKVREAETSDEWEWNIVGTIEADPAEDKISNESPVGKALVGKKVGEVAVVDIPSGRVRYQVLSISK